MAIRKLRTRFAFTLACAALAPLAGFGAWALATLTESTRASVVAANQRVAQEEAEDIERSLLNSAAAVSALAASLEGMGLDRWQQNRALANYVERFTAFREFSVFDESGTGVASSRNVGPLVTPAHAVVTRLKGVALAPVSHDSSGAPTVRLSVPLRPSGQLVAELGLDDVQALVSDIRVGVRGAAILLDADGTPVLAGSAGRLSPGLDALARLAQPSAWQEYSDASGTRQLGVAARIPAPGWTLVIEQPTAEAFATATHLERQLVVVASIALVLMLGVGAVMGRRLIDPIVTVERATESLASGDFRARVAVSGNDELARLGRSFNTMADRLVTLQAENARQERQALFGRIVAGLLHDLSHPVQNIGNNAGLLLRPDLPEDERRAALQTLQRELDDLKRFMEAVRDAARPQPLERFPVDINATIADVLDGVRAEASSRGIALTARLSPGAPLVDGDRFALTRVHRNLLANAIDATGPGGQITVSTAVVDGQVEMAVADTGVGIPADRLPALFDDFVTTKRRGLGLGLVTSKRIVEQAGGTISVASEPGRGTTFTLRFRAREGAAVEAAG